MFTQQITKESVIHWATLLLVLGLLLIIPQLRVAQGTSAAFFSETFEGLNAAQNPQTVFGLLLSVVLNSSYANYLLTLIPLLLAFGSLLLLFAHVGFEDNTPVISYLTGIVAALTPAFLVTHLSITFSSLLLFCILLTTYLYRRQSLFYVLSFALLFSLDPLTGTILFVFLFWYAFKEDSLRATYFLTVVFLILLTSYLLLPFNLPFQAEAFYFSWDHLFSFFGSHTGFTLTLLLLGIGGLLKQFYDDNITLFTWFSIFIVLLSALYAPLRLIAVFVLSFYSAKAFFSLLNYKFTNPVLGQYLLLLFVCIFLFSSVTFIKTALDEQPTPEQLQTYSWLELNPSGAIFIHPVSAEAANYFTKKPVVTLSDHEYREFVLLRDLGKVQTFFTQNQVRYIVVDQNLRDLLSKDEEGLLFLLENNDAFVQVYRTPSTTIYYRR